MGGELALFVIFGAVAIAGALGVVLFRRPMYSALALLVNFIMLAMLYILLNAPFVGLVQIIVYAGAVMVLFLFTLMLVGERQERLEGSGWAAYVGGALALVLLGELVYALSTQAVGGAKGAVTAELVAQVGNVELLGAALFTDFLLPFELASVLLLVGIVGAVYLALRRSPRGGVRVWCRFSTTWCSVGSSLPSARWASWFAATSSSCSCAWR